MAVWACRQLTDDAAFAALAAKRAPAEADADVCAEWAYSPSNSAVER